MSKAGTKQILFQKCVIMHNKVSIVISKCKSTVASLQPHGVIVHKPFDVLHASRKLSKLFFYLGTLKGDTKIVLECTGRIMK